MRPKDLCCLEFSCFLTPWQCGDGDFDFGDFLRFREEDVLFKLLCLHDPASHLWKHISEHTSANGGNSKTTCVNTLSHMFEGGILSRACELLGFAAALLQSVNIYIMYKPIHVLSKITPICSIGIT